MPRGSNSTNGRVSKTSAPTRSLNEPNIAALEREIAAPHDQVQHQLNSPAAHPARVAPNTLDGTQENTLIQWIRQVKGLFSLPMRPLIVTSATQILNGDGNGDGNEATISNAWVDRFIKRLPDDLKPPKVRSVKKKTYRCVRSRDFGALVWTPGGCDCRGISREYLQLRRHHLPNWPGKETSNGRHQERLGPLSN